MNLALKLLKSGYQEAKLAGDGGEARGFEADATNKFESKNLITVTVTCGLPRSS